MLSAAFVQGEDDVDFQYLTEVIDMARAAAVEKVGLLRKKFSAK